MEQCQPGELKENQNIDNGCMSQIFVTEITMEMCPKTPRRGGGVLGLEKGTNCGPSAAGAVAVVRKQC